MTKVTVNGIGAILALGDSFSDGPYGEPTSSIVSMPRTLVIPNPHAYIWWVRDLLFLLWVIFALSL